MMSKTRRRGRESRKSRRELCLLLVVVVMILTLVSSPRSRDLLGKSPPESLLLFLDIPVSLPVCVLRTPRAQNFSVSRVVVDVVIIGSVDDRSDCVRRSRARKACRSWARAAKSDCG